MAVSPSGGLGLARRISDRSGMAMLWPQIDSRRVAFPALLAGNAVLALGPWMVRLADVGPVAAAFWRMALAVPLLFLLAGFGWRRRPPIPAAMLGILVLGGLFFAADLGAWHVAILRTKLANATLFGNMSSFLFALYGFVILRTLPGRLQGFAIALAAAGAALMLGSSYELSPRHFGGDLLALLAGFFYFLYLVMVDRARAGLGAFPVLALASAAGALPLLGGALLLGETILPTDWTPLVLLALSSQVIGQGLLVFAIGHLRPLVVGLALLTQPAITALIGWFAYGEGFGAADMIGAAAICIALVLIRLPAREPA